MLIFFMANTPIVANACITDSELIMLRSNVILSYRPPPTIHLQYIVKAIYV